MKTVRRKIVALSLAATAALILLPSSGLGAQCNITSTPLNFGSYDPLSNIPLTATGSLNVSCNPNRQTFSIQLQLTAGNSGSYAQRAMSSGTGDQLLYNIYANAARTAVLGDGSGGSIALTQNVTRQTPWTVTLFGHIPPLQNIQPGLYGDLLTATILW